MESLKWVGLPVLVLILGYWITGRRWFVEEVKRNETSEAPSDQQIRWHITHMREDLHVLVLSNYVLTVTVIAILLFR